MGIHKESGIIGHRGVGTTGTRGRQEGDRVGIERITITLATLAPMGLKKSAVNVKNLWGIPYSAKNLALQPCWRTNY